MYRQFVNLNGTAAVIDSMTDFFKDLRLGLRVFRHQPGFAFVAVLVLGLGIGANTTIFSLVNSLVLKPRPGAGERLVSVYSKNRAEPDSFRAFSYANFSDLRAHTEIFASLTAHNPAMVGITEGGTTRRAMVDITTSDVFTTFDLPLTMGRAFTREEERPGADLPVAILSHSAWTRAGASPDVIGSTMKINQRDFTVIGVAPKGFGGTMAMVSNEAWVPLGVYATVVNDFASDGLTGTLSDRRHHALIPYGRLREGVTIESAAPMLAAASASMESAYPVENKDQDLVIGRLSRVSVTTTPPGETELSILAASLLSMSGIVLLVASLNLANMQLARAGARRKEFAIRLAIGGSKSRLVRQLITEGIVLALCGGAIALFASWAAMRALLSGMNGLLPLLLTIDPTPDWRIFAATLLFGLAGTLISGLGPALSSARTAVLPHLKEHAGELPVARRGRFATRHLLVMGQLALSLTLLTTAGAFVRGAFVAAGVDPGFSLDRGVLTTMDTGLANYDQARTTDTYSQVLERVRQVPGVTHAAFATQVPFGEISEARRFQKAGTIIPPSDPNHDAQTVVATNMGISPDYFASLGLALTRGRDFTDGEWRTSNGTAVAIIDQSLATRLFGQDDPIGRRLQTSPNDDGSVETIEVVGLAPPIRHDMFEKEPGPHVYRPYAQTYRSGIYLHAQTAPGTDESTLLPALRRVLQGIDSQLPVLTLETAPMYRERNPVLWLVRTGATLFAVFGGVALFMAALGIYGVKAYLVSRRTREIGIRMALGATARDVISLVMRDGIGLAMSGLILGLVLSALAVRAISGFLFGGGSFDAPIVTAAFVTLAFSALVASWIPARRATRIAPTTALRAD
ncbi:MAG TPA: ABC transporter permease [Vicinamibacterales bacterium]|nr:ABC transporter permease [Vicinamibacterales bacterium]